MDQDEYVRHLESRLAILRHNCDVFADESRAWREKYEGVEPRIEALEMIVTRASVTNSPPVGRTLTVAVTVNEDMIIASKDSETMVQMTVQNALKHLEAELKTALWGGQLSGARVPMLQKPKWLSL